MIFEKGASYRATGVVLSDIVSEGIDSRTLFDDPVEIANISAISKAVDAMNKKFGKYAVHIASADRALSGKVAHPRNESAWRKTALLKGETFRRRIGIPLLIPCKK